MKEIKSVIKHSSVIAISNQISLLQRKLFNYLVGHAYIDLGDKDIFEININALTANLWFNSNNHKYLKQSLKDLIAVVVEFNVLAKDKDPWSASSLLASVEFDKWVCYYAFSPVLRSKLHQPNIYAKLDMSLMKLFQSKYSLCLYELFVDYKNIRQTPVINIKDLRLLLWVWDKYEEFKRLNAKVIAPALAEINDIIWFKITATFKRDLKRVVWVKFNFLQIPIYDNKKKKQTITEKNMHLQRRLIGKFWLTLRQANSTLEKYPIPYVMESLTLVEKKRLDRIIKNIPAYTLTVLKNDYVPLSSNSQGKSLPWESKSKCVSQNSQEKKKQICKTKDGNLLLHSWGDSNAYKIKEKAKKYFSSLSKQEQDKLIEKFESEKITSDILQTLYKKDGLEGTIFKVMFNNYLSKLVEKWNLNIH